MDNPITSLEFSLSPFEPQRLAFLWGPFDDNLRQIERRYRVQVSYRDNQLRLAGLTDQLEPVKHIIETLYGETANAQGKAVPLSPEQVHMVIQQQQQDPTEQQFDEEQVSIKTKKGAVKGRNANQSAYVRNIQRHDVTFGIGPAGTGKTYLAVACAVDSLEKGEVRRIVLTRPAVEAGEKLGFLPW